MKTIGEKIYTLRSSAGISQENLAEKLNVSRQTVSRWETNNSKPTKRNIKFLCSIFGVDKNYFSAGYEVAAVDESVSGEVKVAEKNSGLKIFAAVAVSVFLICCIAGCYVAGYVAFLPSYANGLNNAAASRFHYIGIVCIVVGALALAMLACLIIIVIKTKISKK